MERARSQSNPSSIGCLVKVGQKPRLQPSSADPSILAGAPLNTEDDVLHLRHLPDWGGALKASDVEYLLQVLLTPYLRVPLLLRFFFADPIRTSALSRTDLQQMLDASLFEPGEWQPDSPKVIPTQVPAPNRAHLATRVGILFNELTHSPTASVSAVTTILDNALDLDAGRYVRGGGSSTILYAIRLVTRVESYVNYLLSHKRIMCAVFALPGHARLRRRLGRRNKAAPGLAGAAEEAR